MCGLSGLTCRKYDIFLLFFLALIDTRSKIGSRFCLFSASCAQGIFGDLLNFINAKNYKEALNRNNRSE
jgi:hypothetical protein